MPPFIPGLRLNELFYQEAVQPILASHFPGLVYSAARIGPGSDVLGYDTPQSTDHDWGPQLQLFVADQDYESVSPQIIATLSHTLPYDFYGFSTHFSTPGADELKQGQRPALEETRSGAVNHRVTVHTVASFCRPYLGFDPRAELDLQDWLIATEQKLLTIVSGQVYHDGLGDLQKIRIRLNYYPDPIWLALLAAQWHRIGQEEPFMARCGVVNDDLGSRLIGARLVQELMRLCFLIERRYAPYSKWFGTAFARLACAEKLMPIFAHVLSARSWQTRQRYLSAAYTLVAQMHNALDITEPLKTEVSYFYNRPYLVIHADDFAAAIQRRITGDSRLITACTIGSIDQFVASTDVLSYTHRSRRLTVMYQG